MTTPLLAVLYLAAVLAVAAAARILERPIPGRVLGFLSILPVLLLAEAFASDLTILPADHGRLIPPWSARGGAAPRNPNLDDAATQFAPWEAAAREAWRGGELPLRDRWSGCGEPLAANAQSAAFSPVHLLALALPLPRAFTLIAALHVLLAGAGMWLWTRELGASPAAALVAAPAWALSLAITPWLLFPHTGVLSLWPWLLFLAERASEPRLARRVAAALAIVLAWMVLAGHPESLALGCLFCGTWLLLRAALERDARFLRGLLRVAACGAAAAALAAGLLLPFLHALAGSNRLAGLSALPWARFLSAAPHGPAWPEGPMQLLFPFAHGEGIASPMVADAPSDFSELAAGYSGLATAIVALLALRPGRRSRATPALLILAAAGMLVAVGQWPLLEAVSRIPLLRMVVPLRFLTWTAAALPAVAALELDRYATDAAAGRRPWRALAGAGLVAALAAAAWFLRHRAAHAAAGGLAFQARALAAACGVALALAAAGLLLRGRTPALCAAAAALVAGELLVDARHLYRAAPSSELFPETPLVTFLRARPGVFRTAGAGSALFPDTNVFAGVPDARTHDPLESREYLEFLDESCGYPTDEYFRALRRLDCAALDFLNARYLVAFPGEQPPAPKWTRVYAGTDGTVFENSAALPRAFAPRRIRFAREVSARDVARRASWEAEAVLREVEPRAPLQNAPVRVDAYEEAANRAAMNTSAPRPGIVVASLVQDGGWSARAEDGRELRTWRANGPFLAVEAPAGEHRITLRYSPPGFLAGLAAAGVALVLGAAWCLRRPTY